MLNAQGRIIGDFTLANLGDGSYFIVGSGPAEAYHMRWFERQLPGDGSVSVRAQGLDLVGFSIGGPRSRELLSRITEEDVSASAFQFMDIRDLELGNLPARVGRVSFTGDLGYEIWVDAGSAVELWDRLLEAGASFGILPTGLIALDMARIEAGLVLISVDYVPAQHALIEDQKSSPFELGLGWTVSLDRGPFVGEPALAKEKAAGSKWQMVGIEASWEDLETLYESYGLPPALPAAARLDHRHIVGVSVEDDGASVQRRLVQAPGIR